MKGLGFYETAAQVIPVLVLVVVVESRMQKVWPYLPRLLRMITFLILTLVVVAEWRALHVLQTEHASRFDSTLVWLALIGLAGGIITGSTGSPFTPAKSLPPE